MNCIALTPRALRWLENGRTAQVLNLFNEVCNLVDEKGNVISLVSPRIGKGPFSMVIEGDFSRQLDKARLITIDRSAKSLSIGPLTIDTQQAAIWDPVPAWHLLKTEPVPSETLYLVKQFAQPLRELLQGISADNSADCVSGTYQLAGLGPGLTPAGDDILMGILFGLWVWYPREDLIRLIAQTAVPRTTTLSAAFLTAAAAGEATVHWHNLVAGMTEARQQIWAIGATSGPYTWTGFTSVAQHLAG